MQQEAEEQEAQSPLGWRGEGVKELGEGGEYYLPLFKT